VLISNWQEPMKNFDGFMVFVVNEDTIFEDCRIAGRNYRTSFVGVQEGADVGTEEVFGGFDSRCNYCGYLPRRSLVFDGNLMTMYNHDVMSTDMDTCRKVWSLAINIEDADGGCCY
jgi:hypothetical protein